MPNTICLMLKTADQRCFFTHSNNYPQLLEFATTCDAELSVVRAQDAPVVELDELARSICNHGLTPENTQYEVLEVKVARRVEPGPRTRSRLLAQAKAVSGYLRETFLASRVVSLADLETKFSEFKLSKPALCNHIARIRTEMAAKGYTVSRIKRGAYQMSARVS